MLRAEPDSLSRLRRHSFSLGAGGVLLKDSYLSPLNYGGWSIQLGDERSRMLRQGWLSQRYIHVSLGQTDNPAQNASISRLELRLSQGFMLPIIQKRWGRVYLGPSYTLGIGGLYSDRNGNNPATFKADASLGLMLSYSYRLPDERFPMLVRLSSRTDLIGTHWGQEYGESYYSLYYLSKALAKRFTFTWFGNAIKQELRIGVDLPLYRRLIATLTYRIQYQVWRIQGLDNRQTEHGIQLGITRYIYRTGGKKWLHEHQALPF